MIKLRNISKVYYFRQTVCCWLASCMLFLVPAQVTLSNTSPGADAIPGAGNLTSSVGASITNDTAADFLEITQTGQEAIMNWNNFDIGTNATVQFIQPGSTSAALNRIHDGSPTGIMGTLTANGRVFIINPAGVLFGQGSVVNVNQLVASSLNITDEDFLAGRYNFAGVGDGEIANYGSIEAVRGVVCLGTFGHHH